MANSASALYADAALWLDPNPDHVALDTAIGGASAIDSRASKTAVVQLAHRTPVALAFQLVGDEDHIYVGHTPSVYPADPLAAYPFDNKSVLLLGDDFDAATSICLPDEAWQRPAALRAHNMATLVAGHGQAPPVYHSGPHARGTANTDEIRSRDTLREIHTLLDDCGVSNAQE